MVGPVGSGYASGMAQIQREVPLVLLPPVERACAAATGNNAAWKCLCERALPLVGTSASGRMTPQGFHAVPSERNIVRCPQCLRVFVVVGDKSRGAVVTVQELPTSEWPLPEEDALLRLSTSGVRISADFRDNLIIDRDDAEFATMRAKKQQHLRSENSEDVVTWNVFRTLSHLDSGLWFPKLFQLSFPEEPIPEAGGVTIRTWASMLPPPGLLAGGYKERASEIDVIIESASFVWIIEGKYKSDIAQRTTYHAERDQIVRNIDVGSHYAGDRPFYFSLLILSAAHSPLGKERLENDMQSRDRLHSLLPHRVDGVPNLKQVSLLLWSQLASLLAECAATTDRPDEKDYCTRALAWLAAKGILPIGL